MAEQIQKTKTREEHTLKQEKEYISIVRIMQTDIPGNKKVLTGLTYIKGVSWSVSNAICRIVGINPMKKISELNENEIKKITDFLNAPKLPNFLMNRRKDFDTGKDYHLVTTELDMKKEFDVRRLKKIRSYRGLRHALGQPSRGQRTKSHFRTKGKKKAVGVKSKK